MLTLRRFSSVIVVLLLLSVLCIPATAQMSRKFTLTGVASAVVGDVVVVDITADESVTLTTTVGHENVVGIAAEAGTPATEITVRLCGGYASVVNVTGTVASGDVLITSTTAGRARTASDSESSSGFAFATSDNPSGLGTVAALLVRPNLAYSGDTDLYIDTLHVTGQITSTLADGTAPLVVTSTTVNTNLNADLLDGNHAAAFQAADATLTALAGAGSANTFPYFTVTDVLGNASITAAGLALLDDADAAAQRTTLGIGTGDSPNFVVITLGVDDTTAGAITGYGNNDVTGFAEKLYNAANEDTSVQYWNLTANGDFEIGADGTPKLTIDDATGTVTLAVDLADSEISDTLTASKTTNLIGGNSTTLLGSVPYQSNVDTTTLLEPNTTITKKFLRQTGTGTNGAAPAWDTVAAADVGNGLTDAQVSDTLTIGSGGSVVAAAVGTGLTDAQVVDALTIDSPAGLIATYSGVLTNSVYHSIISGHTTSGDAVDGFGSGILFRFTDSGVSNAVLGAVRGVRDSADTEGALKFYAGTNGLELAATFDHNLEATFTGQLQTVASAAVAGAGLNLPHGVVPNSPVDGDVWTTTAGYFARINGVSEQLTTASGGAFTTLSVTGSASIGTTSGGMNVGSTAVTAGSDNELRVGITDQGAYSIQGVTGYFSGDLTVLGGDVIGTTGTLNLFNEVSTTVNAFGAATTVGIGAATGTCTINNANVNLVGYAWNTGYASTTDFTGHYNRRLIFTNAATWYEICTVTIASPDYAAAGMHIKFNAYSWSTVRGAWEADLYFTHTTGTTYNVYCNSRGPKNSYEIKIRDMGSGVYGVWARNPNTTNVRGTVEVTYRIGNVGLISFANFGVAGTGGSGDVAESDTYDFGGGAVTTVGGVHVGGTSDPGTDNLIVDGTTEITGVLTASAVANVINIGTSCTMTAPPAIGGTTQNTIAASTFTSGVNDTTAGTATFYGNSTTTGGGIYLYNAANQDTTVEYWQMYVGGGLGGILTIGQAGTASFLLDSFNSAFIPAGGLSVGSVNAVATGGLNVGSTSAGADNDEIAVGVSDVGAYSISCVSIWATANISALSFTDRTPMYTGDALTEIARIRDDGKGGIDHATLPEFAKAPLEVAVYEDGPLDDKGKPTKIEIGTVVEEGRDIGAMVSMLTVAVNQLSEKNKALEAEIVKLKAKP